MYDYHIILDFEMNPVDKKNNEVYKLLRNEIIEMGAVKVSSEGKIVDKFSCMIKPEYNRKVVNYITRLTGINTIDLTDGKSFSEAVDDLKRWIGDGKIRVYSWSDSDLIQLKAECMYKEIEFPQIMNDWQDFQITYPEIMGIKGEKALMSLEKAAEWYGVSVDKKKVHRALYDAQITTELVIPVLTGEYEKQRLLIKKYSVKNKNEEIRLSSSLSELCSNIFNENITDQGYSTRLEKYA